MVTKVVVAVFVVIIALFGVYAALCFPRTAIDFSVSFALGADQEERVFDIPLLHDNIQIQVIVDSGSSLWQARITDLDGNEVWEHMKAQGEQTSYTSGWIALQSGQYNFTFGTVGIGDLQANVKITTKGEFW